MENGGNVPFPGIDPFPLEVLGIPLPKPGGKQAGSGPGVKDILVPGIVIVGSVPLAPGEGKGKGKGNAEAGTLGPPISVRRLDRFMDCHRHHKLSRYV